MAGPVRARSQEMKPAAAQERAAPARRATPPVRMASRLPSPPVAAAILKGAQQTERVQPAVPAKRPEAPRSVAMPQVAMGAAVRPPPSSRVAPPMAPAPMARMAGAAAAAVIPVARPAAPLLEAVARVAAPAMPAGGPKEVAATPGADAQSKMPGTEAPSPKEAASSGSKAGAASSESESESESTPSSGSKPAGDGEAEAPAAKEAAGKGKPKAGKSKGAKADAEAADEDGDAGGAGAVVKLHMPEPPSGPSPATKKRIAGVKARAGGKAASHGKMPDGGAQVADARKSVTEPDAEANAKAQAALIAQVQAGPSPEIVKLCERIREVIRNKRPPDEDALVEAMPDSEAMNAGNQLNSTVDSETKKVQDNYGPVNAPPAAAAPAQGAELKPQPPPGETAPINAQAATPDAVPDANVSLDKDAEEAKKKQQEAGMETEPAKLVQSGPVAEARAAQGELDQAAKEDPEKVLGKQKEALARAEGDMAALQAQALAALTTSRETTANANASRQGGMIGSEESMRTKAAADAQKTFDDAKNQVNALLQPLAKTAMDEWEAAKEVLVTQFKNDLAPIAKRVEERHSGVGGFFTGLYDAVAGLPDWAEEGYTRAETRFADGVIAKLTSISTHVNSVVATCDLIITNARERIQKIFSDLPESLQAWATQEQAKFDGQLDQLHNEVISARDNFNKDLIERSSAAVDEVRAEIADLRKKAGGLIGRIVNAINKFIEDPVKFIIEGLLELLGIPPAAFWAVVAKIKQVVKDIADDPMKFANNLLAGLAQGFSQFFDNILSHLLKGFIGWLTGGLGDVGVQLPKDASLKSLMTFFLQLMGITWPRIRKILAKHVGEKNVALLEKVYSLVSLLIEKGPEGIYELIKEKLDPQAIVDQVIQLAVDFLVSAVVKAVTPRIIALFNPAGAIIQALEAIYRVLKWVFQNAAKIFTLIETVVNGIADILAGSIGGFANAVEKALSMLIAPVIGFLADYLGFGDLPGKIAEHIKSFQEKVLGFIEQALVFLIEKGKALLAAMGIGKKKDEKEKSGTPHENAVQEVAGTLAQEPDTPPATFEQLREIKQKEADELVIPHNQALEPEHVKMTVTFEDKANDEKDGDLDFTVTIAPNTAETKQATPFNGFEPIAGEHQVQPDREYPGLKLESHHVPAKAVGTAIANFLDDVASRLRKKPWADNDAAQAAAAAIENRAENNRNAAKAPGNRLSAILLSEASHRGEEGAHSIEGSASALAALKDDPGEAQIVFVKRKTLRKLKDGGETFLSVNPQQGAWRIFLADIHRAISDTSFVSDPTLARGADEKTPSTQADKSAAELIIQEAQEEFLAAEEVSDQYMREQIVERVDKVIDRAVWNAYVLGKTSVKSAMDNGNEGTPKKRKEALAALDTYHRDSWGQFSKAISDEIVWP